MKPYKVFIKIDGKVVAEFECKANNWEEAQVKAAKYTKRVVANWFEFEIYNTQTGEQEG